MNDQESQKESMVPTPSDYMAAAMITNGIAWVWTQVVNSLTILNQIPIKFLTDITFIVYVLAGAIGAFLAGKRADSKHLQVGLKATGYSLGVNALIMLTNPCPSVWISSGVCRSHSPLAASSVHTWCFIAASPQNVKLERHRYRRRYDECIWVTRLGLRRQRLFSER